MCQTIVDEDNFTNTHTGGASGYFPFYMAGLTNDVRF